MKPFDGAPIEEVDSTWEIPPKPFTPRRNVSTPAWEEPMGTFFDIFELLSVYTILSLTCAVALSLFSRATKRAYDERILTLGW